MVSTTRTSTPLAGGRIVDHKLLHGTGRFMGHGINHAAERFVGTMTLMPGTLWHSLTLHRHGGLRCDFP